MTSMDAINKRLGAKTIQILAPISFMLPFNGRRVCAPPLDRTQCFLSILFLLTSIRSLFLSSSLSLETQGSTKRELPATRIQANLWSTCPQFAFTECFICMEEYLRGHLARPESFHSLASEWRGHYCLTLWVVHKEPVLHSLTRSLGCCSHNCHSLTSWRSYRAEPETNTSLGLAKWLHFSLGDSHETSTKICSECLVCANTWRLWRQLGQPLLFGKLSLHRRWGNPGASQSKLGRLLNQKMRYQEQDRRLYS